MSNVAFNWLLLQDVVKVEIELYHVCWQIIWKDARCDDKNLIGYGCCLGGKSFGLDKDYSEKNV
jgi:hypothetical protein